MRYNLFWSKKPKKGFSLLSLTQYSIKFKTRQPSTPHRIAVFKINTELQTEIVLEVKHFFG